MMMKRMALTRRLSYLEHEVEEPAAHALPLHALVHVEVHHTHRVRLHQLAARVLHDMVQ